MLESSGIPRELDWFLKLHCQSSPETLVSGLVRPMPNVLLEQFFSVRTLRRLRSCILGDLLDDFAKMLKARGHTRRSIHTYVLEARLLAAWLTRGKRPLESVDDFVVQEYLAVTGPRTLAPMPADAKPNGTRKAALNALLRFLRAAGRIPSVALPPSEIDLVIQRFNEHSRNRRGLAASTCVLNEGHVRRFLEAVFRTTPVKPTLIKPDDLSSFIATVADRGHTGVAKSAVSALRALIRYFVLTGECHPELVDAVPSVVHRSPRLPRYLAPADVERVLESFNGDRAVGYRDHAMVLCLARLGLRISEVARLRLSDVNWRLGTIRISAEKSRRDDLLPLPHDVGSAIARYIRRHRPQTAHPHIFVTHLTPIGRPLCSASAQTAIQRGFDRAKLSTPLRGTHVFRHTVATQMVRHGIGLKRIADVLRHRSLNTTAIYARVDLPALRAVAMPWPAESR